MDNQSYNIRVPKRWVRIALIVGVTTLVVAPLTAVATHMGFTDVPESNTHHNDIAWLKDANVTKGCNPPANDNYCPNDFVTRAQMATFMRNLAQNQVVDAGTLEGVQAGDFLQAGTLTTTVGGAGWLPHNNSPTSVARFISGTRFSGDGNAVLSLDTPVQIGTATYGLETFTLCYIVGGGGFVDRVRVFRTNEGSTSSTEIFTDTTDQTTSGCTTYTVERSVGGGASIFVDMSGGGTVRLEGLTATWSEAANIAAAGEATEDGDDNG